MTDLYVDNGVVALRIESDEDEWASQRWEPCRLVTEPKSPPAARHVVVSVRPGPPWEPRSWERSILHMEQEGRRSGRTWFNVETGNTYEVDDEAVTITTPGTPAALLDVFQVLRGVLLLELVALGGTPVHASVLTVDDRGIAFVGPSGAGKTTFGLTAALALPGASYVTGDKSVLMPDGRIVSLPFATSIGSGTLSSLPPGVSHGSRRLGDKHLVWLQTLSDVLGVPLAASTHLEHVVLCDLRLGREVSMVEASPSDRHVAAVAMAKYSHATSPLWLADAWGIGVGRPPTSLLRPTGRPMQTLSGDPGRSTRTHLSRTLGGLLSR